ANQGIELLLAVDLSSEISERDNFNRGILLSSHRAAALWTGSRLVGYKISRNRDNLSMACQNSSLTRFGWTLARKPLDHTSPPISSQPRATELTNAFHLRRAARPQGRGQSRPDRHGPVGRIHSAPVPNPAK